MAWLHVLMLAGSNSGVGAGIQARVKACTALGPYCSSAITAGIQGSILCWRPGGIHTTASQVGSSRHVGGCGEPSQDNNKKANAPLILGDCLKDSVLNQSPLFIKQLKGQAPRVNYIVNDKEYQHGYYLADGIYPEWAAFVKTVSMPQTEKHKLFAAHQEGARKDVERAFGALQRRFSIVRYPARLYDRGDLQNIMLACIILHNMIVEDEKEEAADDLDLNEAASTSTVLPSVFQHGDIPEFVDVLQRDANIRDRPTHRALKNDLVEHIWKKFGSK